ncbi:sugar phosphate isomerase/epimerase family protein [Erwinia sp. ACCC 02193]|jgi:4-hydroxyphenylpyruvate dioxygenase|uniref:Sugar phosphate isomerase/epimerase family protein n=1 Tax=Erwinia aeris TaxID=3239803 RepID=A0ABV4E230_9GAMM|nr:sugar phosphate isomerase/epimerase family protein [Erwinia sp. BC051422]MDN8539947.1 sugar phosphate isomerase/epimerase family protein [Erwinia sp. BC051422]
MRFQHNPLFINTVLLSGTTEEKIIAAAQAGFSQLELWRQDVDSAEGTPQAVASLLEEQRLALTDYQVLLDFDGAPDDQREEKRRDALKMMETAAALGATTLLTPASTQKECIAGREEEDIRWLAQEAGKRGLRVAFEAMAWSTHINTTAAAWQLVQRINEPNLGLVVDAFHIFVRNRTVADLNGIPMDKIFLVQLSDLATLPSGSELVETARHHRLLPGQGNFPLYTLLDYLEAEGYSGPVGLEVFNDEIKQRSPSDAAKEAMHALKRCCAQATIA